jgi:predicted glycoside hydrolase/deacetylase ChbG (UPF0249 family)
MPRLIIVNADDLGYDPAIDRGILEAATRGVVRSATLLVNLPGAVRALALSREVRHLAVGLHLNFARGLALGGPSSLAPRGGVLDERCAPSAGEADVLSEARAQLARFEALAGRPPTHLDVHKHLHRHPAILSAVAQLARERALPVRAIDPAMRESLRELGVATPAAFFGDTGPTAFWSGARLLEALEKAPQASELMCHPGFAPAEVRTGYSLQRLGELEALTDPSVVARARRGDVVLGTFADLPRP